MGALKLIRKPRQSEELAEAVGIMLGDGSNYANFRKGAYQVRIAANSKCESDYLLLFMKPLFERLFGIEGRISFHRSHSAMYLRFDSRNLVYFFDGIGVPFGGRKAKAGIPEWIKAEEKYLAACLRGLFDTDGSVYRLARKYPNLLRISFKNANEALLEDVRAGLLALGFHPSKATWRNVFLTRKSDVCLFADKIGFNNPKNQNRLNSFSPVV